MNKTVLPVLATASGMLVLALPGVAEAQAPACLSGSYPSFSVESGQDVELCGAHVAGSILVHAGGTLGAKTSSIGGSVIADGAARITLCGDTVRGAVSVSSSTGPVEIGDEGCAGNTIGATLSVKDNLHDVDVSENTIAGSMIFSGNAGSLDSDGGCFWMSCTNRPEAGDNVVGGSLSCRGNGGSPPGVFTDNQPDRARGAITGDCVSEGNAK